VWEIPWGVVWTVRCRAVHRVGCIRPGRPGMGMTMFPLTRCRALVNRHEGSLRIYSTGDLPDVYEDSFMAIAKPDGETFHPTLILVCTRLGIDKINKVYEEALISTLQMEQSIGIAG